MSVSLKTSVGFLINLRHVSLMSLDKVAVNIITYLLTGVSLKISYMSRLIPICVSLDILLTD